MQQGGVDIVAAYVFWIHHEEAEGEWDFSGRRNLQGVFELLSGSRDESMAAYRSVGARRVQGTVASPGLAGGRKTRGELTFADGRSTVSEICRCLLPKSQSWRKGICIRMAVRSLVYRSRMEYGHAGGPSDREEGMAHAHATCHGGEKKGLEALYVSATGWGGAYVPGSFLPVLGGYVDAPWANHTHELAASENFLFQPFHDDANIASDFSEGQSGFTFDAAEFPYLTAELGGTTGNGTQTHLPVSGGHRGTDDLHVGSRGKI